MVRTITQRDLVEASDGILRALDQGESFVLTRDGRPVGELIPVRRRRFVPVNELKAAFADLGDGDAERFRADVDAILDQDPTPRA